MNKQQNLDRVREKIALACSRAGRPADSVTLIAVSKTKPWEDVRDFVGMGQFHFGENYVQEAVAKKAAVSKWESQFAQSPRAEWHFIGSLQSNKAKFIPGNFSLFHALDSLSLAKKLNKAAEAAGFSQECLVEVNVDAESTKGGIHPSYLPSFLEELNAMESLIITGLMCIPAPAAGRNPREPFALLRDLLEKVNSAGAYRLPLYELSMGMSADFEAAIEEGATLVRVGTSLFGERST